MSDSGYESSGASYTLIGPASPQFIVLAEAGEPSAGGTLRTLDWIYQPGQPLPKFSHLTLRQIDRLRRQLFVQPNGRPLLSASPFSPFVELRMALSAFIRDLQPELPKFLELGILDQDTAVSRLFARMSQMETPPAID
ncbi:hypothetical protein FQN50_007743 [Emmonsiellopsis sp. PD_5]|nr:hypothetical protein FQN50_007743 [Emmonsiellopsis sp. PD_5]